MSIMLSAVWSDGIRWLSVGVREMSCEEFAVVNWKFFSVQWSLSSAARQSKMRLLTLIFTKLTDVSRPQSDFTSLLWMLFHICAAMYKNVLVFSGRIIVRLVSLVETLILLYSGYGQRNFIILKISETQ